MTGRIKPLLTTHCNNRAAVEKIASKRLESSSEYDQVRKLPTGTGYARRLRTVEMAIVPDQKTAWLIGHQASRAKDILQSTADHLEQPFAENAQYELYPCQQRCVNIRNLPESLLDRLHPVFSQNGLFDPTGNFEKCFDEWHQSYIAQLNQVESTVKKGKGYQTRRFAAYWKVFWKEYRTIKAWFEELIALLAAGGHAECGNAIKDKSILNLENVTGMRKYRFKGRPLE